MPVLLPGPTTSVVRPTPRLVAESGVRLGLAHAGMLVSVVLALTLHVPVTATMLLLLGLAVAAAVLLPVAGAALTAFSCWAIWTGFVENRYGDLTLAPHDLVRLATVVVTVVGACVLARFHRTAAGVSR